MLITQVISSILKTEYPTMDEGIMRFKKVSVVCLAAIGLSLLFIVHAAEQQAQSPETQHAVKRFSHSLDAIRQLYVEKMADHKMLENAIRGMLEKLDPHSAYLDEKAYKNLQIATDGEFSGLGIEVVMKKDAIYVVTPMDGTPAKKAGIESGDYIIRIDGHAVSGMTLTEAVNMMRGKRGTSVNLVIARKGEKKPLHMDIVRNSITVDSVKTKVIDGNYGYIRISSFQAETGDKLHVALAKLKDETNGKLKGVVLDLRNNPGGVLQAAVDVADVFLDVNKVGFEKNVVYTKGRMKRNRFEGKVTTKDHLNGIPVVALVNNGSASAAEIVAAALKDHNRAILMGTKTFGKGSVQTVVPLFDDKTAIKLTTARYYTPNGSAIQAIGVSPDVLVEKVKIAEKLGDDDNAYRVSEASLHGRLDAEKAIKSEKSKSAGKSDSELSDKVLGKKQKEEEKPLIQKDYQLHQAVVMLKGLASLSE